MSLDKTTIAKIADLARIAVPADELAPLAQELSAILGWIEQLNEVDTDDVAPMRAVMPIQTRLAGRCGRRRRLPVRGAGQRAGRAGRLFPRSEGG